jgi:hypothetical protein
VAAERRHEQALQHEFRVRVGAALPGRQWSEKYIIIKNIDIFLLHLILLCLVFLNSKYNFKKEYFVSA